MSAALVPAPVTSAVLGLTGAPREYQLALAVLVHGQPSEHRRGWGWGQLFLRSDRQAAIWLCRRGAPDRCLADPRRPTPLGVALASTWRLRATGQLRPQAVPRWFAEAAWPLPNPNEYTTVSTGRA